MKNSCYWCANTCFTGIHRYCYSQLVGFALSPKEVPDVEKEYVKYQERQKYLADIQEKYDRGN